MMLVVKESYLKKVEVMCESNQILLCKSDKSSAKVGEESLVQYEILYRSAKGLFSLCRVSEIEVAKSHFSCLSAILGAVAKGTKARRRLADSVIATKLHKLVETMCEHPTWLHIHVAAYNGLVDFFQNQTFTPEEISVQRPPEYYTPLHLAVMQEFELIIEIILRFNPNFVLVDFKGNTFLHHSVVVKPDILRFILNKCNPPVDLFGIQNLEKWTPVQLACVQSKREALHLMLTYGLPSRLLVVTRDELTTDGPNGDQILRLDESELKWFDLDTISQGGCPLHWALNASAIERVIPHYGVDTLNLQGYPPLIVMIQKGLHQCVYSLLLNGASVKQTQINGDTALHLAVQTNSTILVKALLVFDADPNLVNKDGISPRQLAEQLKQTDNLRLFDLSEGKLAASNIVGGCGEVHEDGYPKLDRNYLETTRGKTGKPSRLLCFDGGGVKGLFTVQMMIELSRYLKHDLISYFDWLGGTSTGSMIAFSLAQGRDLRELRKMYFLFKDHIMTGNRPYSSQNLENLFVKDLGASIKMGEVLYKYGKHLVITATRVDQSPPRLHLFRSYPYPWYDSSTPETNDPETSVESWKALRASTAAPTFFHSFYPYIDGGVISNNPTMDCIAEFFRYQAAVKRYNRLKRTDLHVPRLELVLSFGTGRVQCQQRDLSNVYNKFYYFFNLRSSFREINRSAWPFFSDLMSQVKSQLTNCNDHIVSRAESWCRSLQVLFFRFNAMTSKKVPLNETNDQELFNALWDVKLYALQKADQLKKIAQTMDELRLVGDESQ